MQKHKLEERMKKGILVVSFGTTYRDTREKTIGAIEEKIRASFPEYRIYRAFTSKIVRSRIEEAEGIRVPDVKSALEQMLADGIEAAVVQPTHIIDGIENELMKEEAKKYRDRFRYFGIGEPLLKSEEDYEIVADILEQERKEKGQAVVFMGHGSEHFANASYRRLQKVLHGRGRKDYYISTVEGKPDIHETLGQVSSGGYRSVSLIPFMIVAGDHAKNDMAGEEDSWCQLFRTQGYRVQCRLKGLGENPAVQELFISHLRRALPR